MTATLRSPFHLSAHLRPTVGDQKISYVGVDHLGWVLCDGRAVSTTVYGLLFGVIGYTFDTSLAGTSSFRLPDFRGTVPGMAGRRPDLTTSNNPTVYAIGDVAGEQIHRLNIDEMPRHTHGSVDVTSNANGNGFTTISGDHFHTGTTDISGTHDHSYTTYANADRGYIAATENDGVLGGTQTLATAPNGSHVHTFTTSNAGNHQHQIFNTGGSNYHNNMQPTLFAGNMFMYSGRNMDGYFPYTWVGGMPAPDGTAPVSGKVLIF